LYRFTNADEWEQSGLSECFRADSVCLVEWPSRAAGLLPDPDLALVLAWPEHGEGRTLAPRAFSAAGERCRDALSAALAHA